MNDWISDAENRVAALLSSTPTEISQVVSQVQEATSEYRSAQIKIATLNLVSEGRAKLDENWRVVSVDD